MEYILKTIINRTGKVREIRALKTFISVPRIFLVLPLFNVINGDENIVETIRVAQHQSFRNIEFEDAQLTIENDFDVFLFILRKVLKNRNTSIEFTTTEMMDELRIDKPNRTQYLKSFIKSVERLSKIHVKYEERINGEWEHNFFNFIEGKLSKTKGKIEVSKMFIEFFGNLKELYGINPDILRPLTKYQRILYVLYICNRKGPINYFNVDMLKERFKINSDKMPDKIFINKVRVANNELLKMGLISGFTETKEDQTKKRSKTIRFEVSYDYVTLYQPKKKVKERKRNANLNLDKFNDETPLEVIEEKETENVYFEDYSFDEQEII